MSAKQIDLDILNAMESKVAAFRNGEVRLPELVSDLSSGLQGMLQVPDAWKSEFTAKWIPLEEVNALALSAGQSEPLNKHKDILNHALNELLTHIYKGKCLL